MKIIHKTNLPDFSLPLPIWSSIHIAYSVCKQGEEYDLFIGLEKKYAEQLIQLSSDESDVDLQNYTGDRARFVEGSYEDWYARNRTPFIVVHKRSDALAAIIWFGPKPLGAKSVKFGKQEEYESQDDWHTVSFRSYPVFRGRGIMKNFCQFVMDVYKKKFTKAAFWTGTDDRNKVFIRLISELGFEINEEDSDLPARWLVMVKKTN